MEVHLFWSGRSLNRLEHWCLQRFRSYGFRPQLWTYDADLAVPENVSLRSAAELLAQDRLFLNRRGSYASFADLFRYTLLHRHGGLWCDLDVVCLWQADALPGGSFLVSERDQQGGSLLNNNVIAALDDPSQALMGQLAARAAAVPIQDVVWAQLGPQLLQQVINTTPDHGFAIQPPGFANPVDWWEMPEALQTDNPLVDLGSSAFLHLYAERWRRAGCDSSEQLEGGRRLERWLSK